MRLRFPQPSEVDTSAADVDIDVKLKEDLSYAAMRGARYKASCLLFEDKPRMLTLQFLALGIEGLRYLSNWWMRRARETDRYNGRVPLFEILRGPTSPLIASMQYVASLLHSDGSGRLELVRRYQQYSSYED